MFDRFWQARCAAALGGFGRGDVGHARENLGFSLYEGRIIGQAPEIDGRLLINDGIELLPGSLPAFARVEITDAHPYDLVGAVVG